METELGNGLIHVLKLVKSMYQNS